MLKRIKVVFLILFCVLALASSGFAASESDTATFKILSQFSVTKNQDLTVFVVFQNGTNTYSDTAFHSSTEAQFLANGSESQSVSISYDNPLTLSDGGTHNAQLTLECRADTTGYPASKTAGTACSGSNQTGTDGNLYISIFPTQIDFGAENAKGTYTGTLTLTVDYE